MGILYLAPKDFAKWAAIETEFQLVARYGFSRETIRRMRREMGIKRPTGSRPMPADFATVAPTKTVNGLLAHYRASRETVRRWLDQADVQPAKHHNIPWNKEVVPVKIPAADVDRAVQAARYLGPKLRVAISRCDAKGKFSHIGDHFRYGNTVMTPQQIIDRAHAKGWDENA